MKTLLILFCSLFVSNLVHADPTPLINLDGFQEGINSQALVDKNKWKVDQNIANTTSYSSLDKTNKIEVTRVNGVLTQFVDVESLSDGIFMYAHFIKLDNGFPTTSTKCVTHYGCMSVNSEVCTQFLNMAGVKTGKDLLAQEKKCADLANAKQNIIRDMTKINDREAEEAIKKISGLQYLRDFSYPTLFDDGQASMQSRLISAMCEQSFWSQQKADPLTKPRTPDSKSLVK